jgi:hypothetical protein
VLYGLGPTALLMYILGTPARRRAREQREAAAQAGGSHQPDAGRQPTADPVAPMRKEP